MQQTYYGKTMPMTAAHKHSLQRLEIALDPVEEYVEHGHDMHVRLLQSSGEHGVKRGFLSDSLAVGLDWDCAAFGAAAV